SQLELTYTSCNPTRYTPSWEHSINWQLHRESCPQQHHKSKESGIDVTGNLESPIPEMISTQFARPPNEDTGWTVGMIYVYFQHFLPKIQNHPTTNLVPGQIMSASSF
ncbi:hypothetical protein ACLOJK_013467, partial [Asimina triloba]